MRISEYYNLGLSQASLDFVDVDTVRDTALFIDPSVLASTPSDWAAECTSVVQGYFQRVLDLVVANDAAGASELLSYLGEDNATRLGYSRTSRGSGVGDTLAEAFYRELSGSAAVQSGMISDLEDTALMIEGVREDRISDVTTNIIRGQLVRYTQETADFYGIETEPMAAKRPIWNMQRGIWEPKMLELPVAAGKPLILVPKNIVRRLLHYNASEYFRHYAIEHFRDEEYRRHSPLVFLLKSGRPHVKKGDVIEKYRSKHDAGPHNPGFEKRTNVDATQQNPDLLQRFKRDKAEMPPALLKPEELAEVTESPQVNFDQLLADVLEVAPGREQADQYERRIEALFTALFYPQLVNPRRQRRIHEDRKIIDIEYTNRPNEGFFGWLGFHFPAANVVIECKNYTRPIGNPEYDQLQGRFSPSRGKYGILVYRGFVDKERVWQSCHDTFNDDRGIITPIDDVDLRTLVDEAKTTGAAELGGWLHRAFQRLTHR